MSQHIVPRSTYFAVFGALMLLTVLTVVIAFIDLGRLNAVAALSIAVVKGSLVILFFMHVRYGSRLTQVIVAAGIFWFLILVALTLADYLSRDW